MSNKCKLSDIKVWNEILYGKSSKINHSKSFSEVLWSTFKIKSWPQFNDCCSYHVPDLWREDVIKMIRKITNELGDKIEFVQIKEKMCRLTVYYDAKDMESDKRAKVIIQECIDNLIEKGLHPKGESYEQGN